MPNAQQPALSQLLPSTKGVAHVAPLRSLALLPLPLGLPAVRAIVAAAIAAFILLQVLLLQLSGLRAKCAVQRSRRSGPRAARCRLQLLLRHGAWPCAWSLEAWPPWLRCCSCRLLGFLAPAGGCCCCCCPTRRPACPALLYRIGFECC